MCKFNEILSKINKDSETKPFWGAREINSNLGTHTPTFILVQNRIISFGGRSCKSCLFNVKVRFSNIHFKAKSGFKYILHMHVVKY